MVLYLKNKSNNFKDLDFTEEELKAQNLVIDHHI